MDSDYYTICPVKGRDRGGEGPFIGGYCVYGGGGGGGGAYHTSILHTITTTE